VGQHWVVKRATAVGHLVEMGGVATEALRFRGTEIGWPLEEMWVGGELLGAADALEVGSVVLVLDVSAAELPWLARHPVGEWVGDQLRLGKRPMLWCYRPVGVSVWGPDHRRLVRFWTSADGTDQAVIDALRDRRFDDLAIVEPTDEELTAQMPDELERSRRHLRSIVDGYWDPAWRRRHNGPDESPEDHLWRAATAMADIIDTLDRPQDPPRRSR
jgi:hypothetical protein